MTMIKHLPRFVRSREFWLIAPYASWMALMMVLPLTPLAPAAAYAVRTATTGAMMLMALSFFSRTVAVWRSFAPRSFAWGVAAGLAVFAIWIAPESLFGMESRVLEGPSPYSPEVCGWTLALVKLFGSAVVIAAAEELFFRKWLVDFAGFWWMVALFAVEHDRWAVGAAAGAIYGLLALKKGLPSAIIAHMTTNFTLGLWVMLGGEWQYW
jgi:CAAX prenyl protease-like protein